MAPAYANRGLAYYRKGDNDRAIADFNQAIQLDPKLAPAYANRGLAYSNKGDTYRAIADLTQAIQLDPKLAQTAGLDQRLAMLQKSQAPVPATSGKSCGGFGPAEFDEIEETAAEIAQLRPWRRCWGQNRSRKK